MEGLCPELDHIRGTSSGPEIFGSDTVTLGNKIISFIIIDISTTYLLTIVSLPYHTRTQREEMGDCEKIHSIALKNEYERAQQRRDYHFEEEVLEYLQSFIKENERKIEINKKRIENVEEDTVQEKLVNLFFICT